VPVLAHGRTHPSPSLTYICRGVYVQWRDRVGAPWDRWSVVFEVDVSVEAAGYDSVESLAEFDDQPAVAEVRAVLDRALALFEEEFTGVALRRIVVTVEEGDFYDEG
jgi:hypothetical protein